MAMAGVERRVPKLVRVGFETSLRQAYVGVSTTAECTVSQLKKYLAEDAAARPAEMNDIPIAEMDLHAMTGDQSAAPEPLPDTAKTWDYIKCGLVAKRRGDPWPWEPLSLAQLQRRLPHIAAKTIDALAASINARPTEEVDRSSIREVKSAIADEGGKSVRILNSQNAIVEHITIDGVEYAPVRLLPAGDPQGDIELRSKHSFEYRSATPQQVAEVKQAREKRETGIAECKKLLRDLPPQLASIEAALTKCRSEKKNREEIGRLVIEQDNLTEQIAAQRTKLAALDASPVPQFDRAKFAPLVGYSKLFARFDVINTLGGELYRFEKSPHGMEVIDVIPSHASVAAAAASGAAIPSASALVVGIVPLSAKSSGRPMFTSSAPSAADHAESELEGTTAPGHVTLELAIEGH